MSQAITRTQQPQETVALTDAVGTTQEIDYSKYADGSIRIPAGSSITSLTFHGAATRGGTFAALYNASNAAVTRTVAAERIYAIPDECRGLAAIKIVANVAGTVGLSLKS